MKNLIVVLILLCTTLPVFSQNIEIKGSVISGTDNMPLPGVNVLVKGTLNGTTTDFYGNFTVKGPIGSIIVVSYIGFNTTEVVADDTKPLKIVLKEDTEALDEVVVIGYGVQKKSVVTASISSISSDDLALTSPTRVDNALKGLASGVMVTSASGQPGTAAKVRIRGVGSINSCDPIYIVDGMIINGGIDYLNPSDIESIEVLKDAASCAIYGARAANGVVLVSTKSGKVGSASVSYETSFSIQNPWKKRDLLNATEYALMMNMGSVNAGEGILYADPYSYGEGTDWQEELFNKNAPMTTHQISINGGSEKVTYYISAGYLNQEGIIGGNYDRSNYERFTISNNNNYTIFDDSNKRNWLSDMKVSSGIAYTRIISKGIETNSEFGSPLGSAVALSPMLSVYAENEEEALAPYSGLENFTPVRDKDGKLYTIAGPSYNEITNPLALLSLPGAKNWSDKFVANLSGEIGIWDNLRFKSSLGVDLAFWGYDGYTKKYYLTPNNKADRSQVYSQMNRGLTWQIENILTYNKSFGKHDFSIVLGQSATKSETRQLGGANYDMIEEDGSKVNINFTNGLQEDGSMSVYGGMTDPYALSSLFGRFSYNYDERYMLQATIRRDGSSNFGPKNKYATFPSFSLGWNITNEKFMESAPSWLNNAKVRFSWGRNGFDGIGAFRYIALSQSGQNYIFGTNENNTVGTKPTGLANKAIKWEESDQTNIGLDLRFLRNSLSFSADYFEKRTEGMLMMMVIPSYVGETAPYGNVGSMKNKGLEMELSYKFNVGKDLNVTLSGNASYIRNELIKYGNDSGYQNLDKIQSIGEISRAENGYSFPYFYGYKTAGIFQNMSDVKEYTNKDGEMIMPDAVPGDVRFVDVNGDGVIDAADRTKIGKGLPDWTFGFNVNLAWKGFDFSMMWQGTQGNDVFDATRRTDIRYTNLPSYMLGSWTGEGTSNKYPRFVFGDNVNWQSSDLYVKDGSYLRLKNIQLGYTLPQRITRHAFISNLRFYVAAENLLTFTKYDGFDPEISSSGTSLGIDRGVYPQARVYTAGLSLKF